MHMHIKKDIPVSKYYVILQVLKVYIDAIIKSWSTYKSMSCLPPANYVFENLSENKLNQSMVVSET